MKKLFFIFCLIFCLTVFQTASAAMLNPNSKPTQPFPSSDTTPNYSGSVNYSGDQIIQNSDAIDDDAPQENSDGNVEETADEVKPVPQVPKTTNILFWIISAIIAGLLSFAWYRYRSKGSELPK